MINSNTAVSADYGGWVGELDILIHSTGNIMHLIFFHYILSIQRVIRCYILRYFQGDYYSLSH